MCPKRKFVPYNEFARVKFVRDDHQERNRVKFALGEGGGGGEADASRGVEKGREAEGYALFELRRSRPVLHSVRRIFIVDLFHRKDVACLRRI